MNKGKIMEKEEYCDFIWIWNTAPSKKDLSCVKKNEKSLLVFCGSFSDKKIKEICFFANRSKKSELEELKNTLKEEQLSFKQINKKNYTKINVKFQNASSANVVITKVFDLFLLFGRPLRQYSCSFLLPLDLKLDEEIRLENNGNQKFIFPKININNDNVEKIELPEVKNLKSEKNKDNANLIQSYEYFLPHIRKYIFDTKDNLENNIEPIRHYRLNKYNSKKFNLHIEKHISANIKDISLYQYYNGIFVLSIQVGFSDLDCMLKYQAKNKYQYHDLKENSEDVCRYECYWHPMVFGDRELKKQIQARQLDDYLLFTKNARILYQTFQEQEDEKKISDTDIDQSIKNKLSNNFSKVITGLLLEFLSVNQEELTRNKRLKQVDDDRMFVVSSYTLLGNKPKTKVENQNFEKLFSFATYVDIYNDGFQDCQGWAYDPQFTQELLSKNRLKRWDANGNYSAYSNYSSIFFGIEPCYSLNPKYPDTMTEIIHDIHVPCIYVRMQIWFLIVRTTLEYFDRRMFDLTSKENFNHKNLKEFSELRAHFIEFNNIYWFRDITSMTQGIEIAELMRKNQNITSKYARIKDELERTEEYLQTSKDTWFQETSHVVGYISALLAFIGIFFAHSPIDTLDLNDQTLWSTNQYIGTILFVTLVASILIFVGKNKPILKYLGFTISTFMVLSLLCFLFTGSFPYNYFCKFGGG